LNPNFRRDDGALRIAAMVYCPLVASDVPNKTGVYPALAEKWESSPDATEYTFHLAPNARWHDGQPVTSADVKWSFDEIIKTKGAAIDYLQHVKSIETPDEHTVKITLNEPDAGFVPNLGIAYSPFVMPKHLYEGTDWATNPNNDKPVGCGPFKFVEWVKGSHIELAANEDFFLGRPHLDRFVMRFYQLDSLINAFEAGEIKYSYDLFPAQEILRLQQDPKYRFDIFYPSLVQWVGFNTTVEPWDDKRVRQAVAIALDREEINERVYAGLAPPNLGTAPEGWSYDESAEFKHDTARAEQLLDEAGYPRGADGVRFRSTMQLYVEMGWSDLAQVMVQQLKEIGIELTLDSMDWAGFSQKVLENDDFVIQAGGGYAGPDPTSFYDLSIATDSFWNNLGYSNPQVDDLIKQARSTADVEERKKLYAEVQKILVDEVPRFNIVEYPSHQPVWSEYKNLYWDQHLLGTPYNFNQSFLYTYLDQ
jgi:peptide/nickel transport system substrate-binding protein